MAKLAPLDQLQPKKIVLLKPSALGDIVHALPVLTALRRRFPDSHLAWVANSAYCPLLEGHEDLDELIPFDRGAMRRGWWKSIRVMSTFLANLRRRQFDLVIDLQGLLRSGLMAAFSRAPRRVGLAGAREGSSLCYTDRIPIEHPESMHAVDRYWKVVEALGGGGEKEFRVPLHPAAVAWAEQILHGCPRPWYILGVGSRWETKRWRTEHFAELTNRAVRSYGGSVFFIGGGDETPLAQRVLARLEGPACDLTGRTSLQQLSALIARADVMLANDTGPLHLGVALGRPVVAPYTCTKTILTGPYHARGGAVQSEVWCQGSLLRKCARMECMDELTADRLWPVMQRILLAWESHLHSA